MNIVILEDEAIMMMFLKSSLEEKGHKVVACFNSYKGFFELLEKEEIDLVFMDIFVKGSMDGTQIASKLRETNKNIKIVFITSYKDSQTIKLAKQSQPNGYLIKPVSSEDLEAILMICEVTMKEKEKSPEIKIATYSFNPINKTVKENNNLIKLTLKELQCLELLIKNKNNYISQDSLALAIWGEDAYSRTNSLRELIFRIRKKLPNLDIKNSINIGYILKS